VPQAGFASASEAIPQRGNVTSCKIVKAEEKRISGTNTSKNENKRYGRETRIG
jgi:hypothetical protein